MFVRWEITCLWQQTCTGVRRVRESRDTPLRHAVRLKEQVVTLVTFIVDHQDRFVASVVHDGGRRSFGEDLQMRDPLVAVAVAVTVAVVSLLALLLLLVVPELLGQRVWDVLAVGSGFEDFPLRGAWSAAEYEMHAGMGLVRVNRNAG